MMLYVTLHLLRASWIDKINKCTTGWRERKREGDIEETARDDSCVEFKCRVGFQLKMHFPNFNRPDRPTNLSPAIQQDFCDGCV